MIDIDKLIDEIHAQQAELRSAECADASPAPKALICPRWITMGTRRIPSYAIGMICIALIAGVSTWLVINMSQSDAEPLLASNHKAPSVVVSKQDSQIDNDARMVTSIEPTSAQIKTRTSTSECSTSASSTSVPQPTAESLLDVSNNLTSSNELEQVEISTTEKTNQLVANAKVRVICNSDFCSAERYIAMIYEDILGI